MAPTDGLTIGEEIGRGASGHVFRATDTRTGEAVAVKMLAGGDPLALLDLKREFRTVRQLHHPGLVRLEELSVEGTQASLTMELVDGVEFTESLASRWQARDVDGVRGLIRRLAAAIHFLHEHGVLHSDLKPSNVLVDDQGRVVVLDFGLSSLLHKEAPRGGTPVYLPPERLAGDGVGKPGDWWAVGVMLFEGLSGKDPFPERFSARLKAQRAGPPEAPVDVPDDLSGLMRGLLEPQSDRRFGWAHVVEALGSGYELSPHVRFVGRGEELARLGAVAQGVVTVTGPAGIGKSRLIAEWVAERDGLLLQGRAHPDAQIPFNAVDGVVDLLAEQLPERWPDCTVDPALQVLFPVLGSVPVGPGETPSDPVELRLAAFAALNTLLVGLASRTCLTIWIDDVQWADSDSTAVFAELLRGELSRRAVLVFSARPAADGTAATWRADADLELELGPLPTADAIQLIGGRPELGAQEIEAAGGSPYLLSRLAIAGADPVNAQLARLPDLIRHALLLISLGAPVEQRVLDSALAQPLRRSELRSLEVQGFVKRSSRGKLELWHDRLGEAVRNTTEPDAHTHAHAKLADAWLARREPDVNEVARHLMSAKRSEEAVPWLWRAADESEKQLAFDRAARHYKTLGELTPHDHSIPSRLGEALDRAGRAADAADVWQDAAERSDDVAQTQRLRLLAGTRHLYSGHLAKGRATLAALLAEEGLRIPRYPLLSSLARRAGLAVRGFKPSRTQSADSARARVLLGATKGLVMVEPVVADALAVRAVSESLRLSDPGIRMQALGLESVSQANVGGAFFRGWSHKLLSRVEELARQLDTPFARGWVSMCRGSSAFFETRFADGVRDSDAALTTFREECVGGWHETNVSMAFLIACLACTGQYEDMARRLPRFRADAQARGDAYSMVALHSAETYFAAIVEGRVQQYLVQADAALDAWPGEGFTSPHYQHFFATTSCLLYLGRVDDAWARIEQTWPKLRKAGFFQLEWLGGQLRHLRARAALRLVATHGAATMSKVAAKEAAVLARSQLPGLRGLSGLLTAAVAAKDDRDTAWTEAVEHLERADMAGMIAAVQAVRSGADDPLTRLLVPAV